MPAYDAELARALRRFISGQESTPDSVPETLGNQAIPVSTSSERTRSLAAGRSSTYPDRDATGAAYQNSPNFYGFSEQAGATMGAYRERMLFVDVEAGGTATVQPDVAPNWWFECAGSVTIALADTSAEPVTAVDEDGNPILWQAVLVTVYVHRVKDATLTWPAGIKWSSSVVNGAPVGPATGATEDVFTLMKVPGKGWRGFVTGTGMV